MIEPTAEMLSAMLGKTAPRALAAVLAIVERDYDVTPKLPELEHQVVGDGPFWNYTTDEYAAECTCGATYGGTSAKVLDDILDHLERQARA